MKKTNFAFIKRYSSFNQGVKRVKSNKRKVERWKTLEATIFTHFSEIPAFFCPYIRAIFFVLPYSTKECWKNNRFVDPMEEEKEKESSFIIL